MGPWWLAYGGGRSPTDGSQMGHPEMERKLKMGCCGTAAILKSVSERKLWKEILTMGRASGIASGQPPCVERMMDQNNTIYQSMNGGKWFSWLFKHLQKEKLADWWPGHLGKIYMSGPVGMSLCVKIFVSRVKMPSGEHPFLLHHSL